MSHIDIGEHWQIIIVYKGDVPGPQRKFIYVTDYLGDEAGERQRAEEINPYRPQRPALNT